MSDKYCPSCSQANSTKKLTLKDFFDEFFSSLISYDSKLLKTLSALVLKPGRITRDYINGKRTSYTNPFRFLLSLAIVYFLMVNYTGDFEKLNETMGNDEKTNQKVGAINFNFNEAMEQEKEAKAALDSLGLTETISKGIEKGIEEASKKDSIILADPTAHFSVIKSKSGLERYFDKHEFFNLLLNEDVVSNFDEVKEKYDIEDSVENRNIFNMAVNIEKAKTEPGTFLSYIVSKLPFTIFFFLPVFALFIWLVYIRKKYNYTDHLIFSFHNQSLLFILLIISFLIDTLFKVSSSGIFLLIFSIYLYKAMRKFYGQGRFKTIVKYMFLNSIFFILATVTVLLLITGSVLTF
ncbi:hypothetical protein GGR42_001229 [Saonia flava]|uniref:DUF3667 domain-containing protein n=1 Tax=Saonia flava TaxID=523696 RepID=A0A846QU68_9FLAO|nr:DUF3667 domain-containing protein [Saonia flava]NJB70767.1 hypothetical protein [Saonia flava]